MVFFKKLKRTVAATDTSAFKPAAPQSSISVEMTAALDIEALRLSRWSQDTGLSLAGYENEAIVLVCTKTKRYLLLIERAAYTAIQRTDLLERFDMAASGTLRLKRQGVYIGTVEENLLMQSKLQQQAVRRDAKDEKITGAYRNFDLIVGRGIEAGASDIHYEFRDQRTVRVRMRVHGKLREPESNDMLSRDFQAMMDAVSAAYNSRADPSSRSHNHFDGSHHQSCSIPFTYKGRKYQLRFQSVKENRGVDIILRLLLNEVVEADILTLAQLGYSPDQIRMMEDAVHRSPGLLIVAGETGSGKSTTLRTLMTYERDSGKKFYSIEDPVEYIQPHVTQIPIQRKVETVSASETPFGAAAKVVLRGDPDKVMPGEVRDRETGSFAKSMTETGHQVLSTVHASSCFGIIPRLTSTEIGMPLETVSSPNFLTALVYQKLMPTLCKSCRVPAANRLSDDMAQALVDLGMDLNKVHVEGPGCPDCKGKGTTGQTVVAEVCEVNERLLALLRQGKHWEAETVWRRRGENFLSDDMRGRTAMEHAMHKVALGDVDPRDVESAFYRLSKYRDAAFEHFEAA